MEMLYNFQECLNELTASDSFELQSHTHAFGQTDYYIPYMMNDALECYFILENAQMKGTFLPDAINEIQLVTTEESPALVIRQNDENVCTLWFETVQKKLQYYRYHEIGHFWVEGQEHWRRLVYIIGTIYDKYHYIGNSSCNALEQELLPLMEFAPFRYWSPIHESLDDIYPDTMEGIETMKALCKEANDHSYLRLLKIYERLPLLFVRKYLTKALNSPKRAALYELIFKKVNEASLSYPDRDYGESLNQHIHNKRTELTKELLAKGFTGTYPLFHKENTQILVMEEHPFTILEWDHFKFRMNLMVSNTDKPYRSLNAGFFDSTGSSSAIYKYD